MSSYICGRSCAKVYFFNDKDDEDDVYRKDWSGPGPPNFPILSHHSKITPILHMTLSTLSILVGKIHFIDNSNHFNTFTLSHEQHHTPTPASIVPREAGAYIKHLLLSKNLSKLQPKWMIYLTNNNIYICLSKSSILVGNSIFSCRIHSTQYSVPRTY